MNKLAKKMVEKERIEVSKMVFNGIGEWNAVYGKKYNMKKEINNQSFFLPFRGVFVWKDLGRRSIEYSEKNIQVFGARDFSVSLFALPYLVL